MYVCTYAQIGKFTLSEYLADNQSQSHLQAVTAIACQVISQVSCKETDPVEGAKATSHSLRALLGLHGSPSLHFYYQMTHTLSPTLLHYCDCTIAVMQKVV